MMSSTGFNPFQIPIDRFIETGFASVVESESAQNVFVKFTATPYRAVLVVDNATGQLIGMITAQDIAQIAGSAPSEASVLKVFGQLLYSRDVIAVRSSATLGDLIRILNGGNAASKQLDLVPVVDSQNRPIAVVRRSSLMQQLAVIDRAGAAAIY